MLLLDLNFLLALAWPNHQFHAAAVGRLQKSKESWATCALTQLGFIRLSANVAVVGVTKSPADAAALLALLVQDPRHRYLESLPSPASEPFIEGFQRILGSKQVTDAYLVSLAKHHHATLLTFDTRLAALAQSLEHVEVLTPP